MKKFPTAYYSFAWVISILSMVGSLYFSEVMQLTPCNLCWYQRILMFPLVLILGVGVFRRDKSLPFYALPLSLLGVLIGLYHSLLQWGIVGEISTVCTSAVSCADKSINWLGFITLPLLSLTAFIVISLAVFLGWRHSRKA